MNTAHIAIVGMAGRFPGAPSAPELWRSLIDGVSSIRRLDAPDRPDIVPVVASMAGVDLFDAPFFGISPAIAEIMDPQHRVLLEIAWEALEDAGYDSARCDFPIGVYAGATANTYFTMNLASHADLLERFTPIDVNVANAGDFLTTRISYLIGLTGPSHAVQCACSTSLVAVCIACQAILDGQCDMALAGGVSVNITHLNGYRYVDGGMLSADGRCAAFSASASGTVFGNGAAMVVLKPLADAVRDRDHIYATIIGSASNNDGRHKVGYMAPSVDGQARVIAEALATASAPAESIGMVEAHGTGTPLGDPIEVRALTKAFRATTDRKQFCSLGSVKTNVGHLDAAAGVTGLIKAALALRHRVIPGTLHVEQPSPDIDFGDSPFYLHATAREWVSDVPRRAGVSAFGVGGTNAHVVLEEAPLPITGRDSLAWKLLPLSARSRPALHSASRRLAAWLRANDTANLADVAFTLQAGRRRLRVRRVVLCREPLEAAQLLEQQSLEAYEAASEDACPVVFVFDVPGGDRLPDIHGLSEADATMRDAIREGTSGGGVATAAWTPYLAQYAAARFLTARGVRPAAIVGDGPGSLLAAAAAGELSIDEARQAVIAGTHVDVRPAAATTQRVTGADTMVVRFGTGVSTDRRVIVVDGDTLASAPVQSLVAVVGQLWEAGVEIDWRLFHQGDALARVSLPTYPFEHQRYWIDRREVAGGPTVASAPRRSARRPPLAVPYAPPASDLHRTLRDAWQTALGIDGIGIDDNFFDLGGDSLLAVRLAQALERSLRLTIPATAMYEGTTIRLLADLIAGESEAGVVTAPVGAIETRRTPIRRRTATRTISQGDDDE